MRITNKGLGTALLALMVMANLSAPALAQADIDFGDDSSEWANDGECDDPRFEGAAMASELEDVDIKRDATDCRTAFEAGEITLVEAATEAPASTQPPPLPEATEPTEAEPATAEIDFGDDSSEWANDGECDDPRFIGTNMAEELLDEDMGRDATDCRTLFESGDITLAPEGTSTSQVGEDIDFGDDSGEWAKDQECDDPRFAGPGMAEGLDDANILRDATDCRNAFNDGTITLAENVPANASTSAGWLAVLADRIDFGDDSGDWPNDGECDDPDFVGPGAATDPYDGNRLGDASDCRAAFIAGTISLKSGNNAVAGGFDYGTDSSPWSNDGQCDDLRFTGPGMAKKLDYDDVRGDATDCRTLEEAGEISIKPVYTPEYAAGAPYDSAGIDFGDDSSDYARDDQCDDPRFEGPGVASIVLDSDRLADASDCRAAFEAGTAVLIDGES